MTIEQLKVAQNTTPSNEDRVDIRSVKLDMSAPASVRAEQYLSQIKNPYAFKCGDVSVNLMFCPEGKTLKQSIYDYLTGQKKKGSMD